MFDTIAPVREFITAFDAKPNWATLVMEEAKEVNEAAANLLKEVCDLIYVANGLEISGGNPDNMMHNPEVAQAVAFIQLIAEIYPEAVRAEAYRRVHASNMSKLDDNGKPIRREDGKVLKGPNYKPADLSDLVSLS